MYGARFDGCVSTAFNRRLDASMTHQMQSRIRAFFLAWTLVVALTPMAGGASTDGSGSARRRPLPPLETPIPRAADAAAIYDAVGDEHPEADDPQAIYLATGVANDRMTGWLKSARPLGDKLIEASALEYRRTIDPQDGFTLGPAYLAPLRTTNRSLPVLVHDAAIRGESDRLAQLLSVQITLAVRTAGDGTLPSSISAIGAVQQHMRSVDGLLARGLLDRATAQKLLEIRAPLATIRDYGTVAAMQAELDALKLELERILLTPLEQRPAAVAGLRITVPVKLDDNAIVTVPSANSSRCSRRRCCRRSTSSSSRRPTSPHSAPSSRASRAANRSPQITPTPAGTTCLHPARRSRSLRRRRRRSRRSASHRTRRPRRCRRRGARSKRTATA